MIVLLVALGLAVPVSAEQRGRPPEKRCSEILTTLYPHWSTRATRENWPRLELRVCHVVDLPTRGWPEIVAWTEHSKEPVVLQDDAGISIVRLVATESVFVIVGVSATRELVHVVTYEEGAFRLALFEGSKYRAAIDMSDDKLTLKMPPDEAAEPVTVYEFPILTQPSARPEGWLPGAARLGAPGQDRTGREE
jgi:hypothetical protein